MPASSSASSKTKYSVVPTGASASTADDDDEPCSCLQRYLMGGALTTEQKAALASTQPEQNHPLVLRLHPESIRQIAYAMFWSMCLLAIVLSKTMVPPKVIEESDLIDVFGYNNVSVFRPCTSRSRISSASGSTTRDLILDTTIVNKKACFLFSHVTFVVDSN